MRRTGILIVAAGYLLSFLAACLAGCFVETKATADHGCCPSTEDSIGPAASGDCCSVTPVLSRGAAPVLADLAPAAVMTLATAPHRFAPGPGLDRPLSVAASPPLVLRI